MELVTNHLGDVPQKEDLMRKEKVNIVSSVPDREIDVTPNWSGMFGYAMVLASQLEEGQGRQLVIQMLEYGKRLEDLRRKNEYVEARTEASSIPWHEDEEN